MSQTPAINRVYPEGPKRPPAPHSGTPWADRSEETKERNRENKRQWRARPEFNEHNRAYQRRRILRLKLADSVMLELAHRKTNSEIMKKYQIDYEDIQRIKNGVIPKCKGLFDDPRG